VRALKHPAVEMDQDPSLALHAPHRAHEVFHEAAMA
jgi:hypothetical protein